MLDKLGDWAPGFAHLTGGWDDPAALTPDVYAQVLGGSRIAPCPIGNSSPESFRLYEALEAGAVPIVQDTGGGGSGTYWLLLRELITRRRSRRELQDLVRRSMGASYWLAQYGRAFPVPVVQFWEQLPRMLRGVDWPALAMSTGAWWQQTKNQVRSEVTRRLTETLYA